MSIKQKIKDAVAALFPAADACEGDDVARELLVALQLASLADARKKTAKKVAVAAGVVASEYAPGNAEAYRSDMFVVVAKTKEPTSRLDQTVLRLELSRAGVSQAKINAALAAATLENKPATSFEVTEL